MKCLFPIWGNMMGKIHTRGMRRTNESFSSTAPPAAPYQAWSGYPDSPDLTATYPYQAIFRNGGTYFLVESAAQIASYAEDTYVYTPELNNKYYTLSDGAWSFLSQNFAGDYGITQWLQANYDVVNYADKVVIFAKTTP